MRISDWSSDVCSSDLKHLTKKRLTKLIVLIIDQVLRHFNLDMISVVASSFGGYLAMLYALEKHDKINKLVLEGYPAMVESSRIPFFMKMMLTPGIKWMTPKLPHTKFILRKIMKEMGHG